MAPRLRIYLRRVAKGYFKYFSNLSRYCACTAACSRLPSPPDHHDQLTYYSSPAIERTDGDTDFTDTSDSSTIPYSSFYR